MARLPDPPQDAARIVPWAQEFKGAAERLLEDLENNKLAYPMGLRFFSQRQYAVSTATGTSQATASAVLADLNEISVGTSGTGGAMLPSARPGRQVWVTNIGTAAWGLYPSTGERIGTAGTNASVTVGVGTSAILSCVTALRWQIMRGS